MQKQFKIIIPSIFFSLGIAASIIQISSVENFTLFYYKGNVNVSWDLSAGNTCNGIKILHSLDKVNFEEIGSISGVCGNSNSKQSFSFVDPNPSNKKFNFYRLKLGNNYFSVIDSVYVYDLSEKQFEIFNNSNKKTITINFRNDQADKMVIHVIQALGSYQFVTTTNSNTITIDTKNLTKNVYVFEIINTRTKQVVKGKFSNF